MGNRIVRATESSTRTSTAEDGAVLRQKPVKEKMRHGVVHVNVTLAPTGNRRLPRGDMEESHIITARGGIIHGTQSEPMAIQRGKIPISLLARDALYPLTRPFFLKSPTQLWRPVGDPTSSQARSQSLMHERTRFL